MFARKTIKKRGPRLLAAERLESRNLLAAVFQHSATVLEHDNVGYFLSAYPSRIERYDVANQAWLAPIALPIATPAPTSFLVDDQGLYVAYSSAVYRYNRDGAGQTHLLNANDPVQAIHSDGNVLFINHTSGYYARLISLNKTTGTIIDTIEAYTDAVHGSSISQQSNRIFGRTSGLSPSDITYVAYTDTGDFTSGGESPYHGDYPGGNVTWVFPGGTRVVDNSGTIYATDNLTRVNSFGSTITDLDFHGADVPILLSGKTLTAFSSSILPTGGVTLNYSPTSIFVNPTNVITFTPDTGSSSGLKAAIVKLSDLNPPTPGQPVNPVGLAYTPDKMELAADGTVLLFSKAQQSIFRWNPSTQTYGATIPLVGTPNFMAYAAPTNTVYLAYQSGLIRKIDLSAANLLEVPFATLPGSPTGLSTAGRYLFATDPSGAWGTHYTFSHEGTLIDSVDWNYYSTEYIWSAATQKMYFFRDDTSPNDLLWEEINANGTAYPGEPAGGIRSKQDSPLHDSNGFSHPIRVAPDGSIVVLGSGKLHDATTLARLTWALANPIKDAAWLGTELFTLKANTTGTTQLQHWSKPTFALDKTVQVAGNPVALLPVAADRLLVITSSTAGVPYFSLFDQSMAPITGPRTLSLGLSASAVAENQQSGATVGNLVVTDTALGHVYSYSFVAGEGDANNSAFTIVGAALKTAQSFNFEGQSSYSIRARVTDGTGVSAEQTFTINITNVNEAPSALSDSFDGTEDTPLVIGVTSANLLTNDSDPEGAALTAQLVAGPGHGTVTVDANGGFRYVPAADYHGPDKFTYRASDGSLSSGVTTVTIQVAPVNDKPVAVNDTYSLAMDTRRTVSAPGVLLNDRDADGQTLTAELSSPPEHGVLTLNSDGSFNFMPEIGFSGSTQFSYIAKDGTTASEPAVVTLTITASSIAPIAGNDVFSAVEDQSLAISLAAMLQNDSDDDGDPLSVLLAVGGGPTRGTLTLGPSGNTLLYTPQADFSGEDSFTYRATDGSAISGLATVRITVSAINDPPSFRKGSDLAVADEGGPQQIPFWATSISAGPPNEAGQTLQFLVTASNPALFSVPPAIDAAGQLRFTPAPNVRGAATVLVALLDSGGLDHGGINYSQAETFQIIVDKPHSLHNAAIAQDVTGDGSVAPNDVLSVINHLNAGREFLGALAESESPTTQYLDVSKDNAVSPLDALLIINYLNAFPNASRQAAAEAEAGAEGESTLEHDLLALLAADTAASAPRKRL